MSRDLETYEAKSIECVMRHEMKVQEQRVLLLKSINTSDAAFEGVGMGTGRYNGAGVKETILDGVEP